MTNIAMERSTMFKFGKPSISMGHLYHGYVGHNQRVTIFRDTVAFKEHVDQGKDGSDQDRVFYDLDRPGKRHVLVILAVM